MLRSLDSGLSAMDQFQQDLDVIGNNIANVNTVGYKDARMDFADTFSQTMQGAGAGSTMQIGTGVATSAINNQFSQGTISSTGNPSDLAINGNGFFIVRDPATGSDYATRNGEFKVDASGYLITDQGMRVQGYSDSGLTTLGDIKIDNTGSGSTADVNSYSFDSTGKLTVVLADGTQFTRGQVLMQNYTDPQALVKEGNNLYSGLSSAGGLSQLSAAGTNGLGNVAAGSIEMSNVDLAAEMTNLITAQRAFQASSRVITTSDDILQEVLNLKR